MKPQDIIFFIIFAVLTYKRSSKLLVVTGLLFLLLSIPLFSLWIFFTAERLTWYAASLFLVAILINIVKAREK